MCVGGVVVVEASPPDVTRTPPPIHSSRTRVMEHDTRSRRSCVAGVPSTAVYEEATTERWRAGLRTSIQVPVGIGEGSPGLGWLHGPSDRGDANSDNEWERRPGDG